MWSRSYAQSIQQTAGRSGMFTVANSQVCARQSRHPPKAKRFFFCWSRHFFICVYRLCCTVQLHFYVTQDLICVCCLSVWIELKREADPILIYQTKREQEKRKSWNDVAWCSSGRHVGRRTRDAHHEQGWSQSDGDARGRVDRDTNTFHSSISNGWWIADAWCSASRFSRCPCVLKERERGEWHTYKGETGANKIR